MLPPIPEFCVEARIAGGTSERCTVVNTFAEWHGRLTQPSTVPKRTQVNFGCSTLRFLEGADLDAPPSTPRLEYPYTDYRIAGCTIIRWFIGSRLSDHTRGVGRFGFEQIQDNSHRRRQ